MPLSYVENILFDFSTVFPWLRSLKKFDVLFGDSSSLLRACAFLNFSKLVKAASASRI